MRTSPFTSNAPLCAVGSSLSVNSILGLYTTVLPPITLLTPGILNKASNFSAFLASLPLEYGPWLGALLESLLLFLPPLLVRAWYSL